MLTVCNNLRSYKVPHCSLQFPYQCSTRLNWPAEGMVGARLAHPWILISHLLGIPDYENQSSSGWEHCGMLWRILLSPREKESGSDRWVARTSKPILVSTMSLKSRWLVLVHGHWRLMNKDEGGRVRNLKHLWLNFNHWMRRWYGGINSILFLSKFWCGMKSKMKSHIILVHLTVLLCHRFDLPL